MPVAVAVVAHAVESVFRRLCLVTRLTLLLTCGPFEIPHLLPEHLNFRRAVVVPCEHVGMHGCIRHLLHQHRRPLTDRGVLALGHVRHVPGQRHGMR
jgi:hypothetical protein